MQRLAIGFVVLAGLGDAAGAHRFAFYLLVLAVPAIAVAALESLAAAYEPADSRAVGRAWVQAVALLLVLVSTAARAPFRGDNVPRLALSTLIACILLFAGQGAAAAWPHVRRRLSGHQLARELMRY
jgi:hypothetical protein